MKQLLAHLTGDYLLQSDWMANNKTQSNAAAVAHAATYTLAFVPLTKRPKALATIAITHYAIDHWRLARHLVYLKNFLGPRGSNVSWEDAKATGYPSSTPDFMAVWPMIFADNTVHMLINQWAIERFK